MSEPLRVGLVAEGPTDYEVIDGAIGAFVGRPYILKLLQPETARLLTGDAGEFGGGWVGVFRWLQAWRERSGPELDGDPVFVGHDILVIQLDADVADESVHPGVPLEPQLTGLLPCARPCPPARATTDALRQVVLAFLSTRSLPDATVFCTPSKTTDLWMLYAVAATKPRNAECLARPSARLSKKKHGVTKTAASFRDSKRRVRKEWPAIVDAISEARRFQEEFSAAVVTVLPTG